jgi:hypothetical protein
MPTPEHQKRKKKKKRSCLRLSGRRGRHGRFGWCLYTRRSLSAVSAGAYTEPITQSRRESAATRARSLGLDLVLFAHPSECSEALFDGGIPHTPCVQRAVQVGGEPPVRVTVRRIGGRSCGTIGGWLGVLTGLALAWLGILLGVGWVQVNAAGEL